MTGRAAALPDKKYTRPGQRPSDELKVVHSSAQTREQTVWDFASLPVEMPLKLHFARCLAIASGPSGKNRATGSVRKSYRWLRLFAESLATKTDPPTRPEDLRPHHLGEFRLRRGGNVRDVAALKRILSFHRAPYDPTFVAALASASGVRTQVSERRSYSTAEVRRIVQAARAEIRPARARIRKHVALLDRWRDGAIDSNRDPLGWALGELLDTIARTGDVPRYPGGAVTSFHLAKMGLTATEAVHLLFLTTTEAVAFLVLLTTLTGENAGTVNSSTAEFHRTDTEGEPRTAIVDLLKPRRGKYKAHMSRPLQASLPSWLPEPGESFVPGQKELLTPLGVFLLLVELGEPARTMADSNALFCHYSHRRKSRGRGVNTRVGRTAPNEWSARQNFVDDDGSPLSVDFGRLRLTHAQVTGKPVAHTRQTLNKDYLVKDRADLARYQRVVKATLDDRVRAAQEATQLTYMTNDDLTEAVTNPEGVADRLGIAVKTLEQLLTGRLDTVLAACKNNTNGPFTPGRACEASFLLCTGCECAVALPAHLPVQVAAHDLLLERQADTTPLDWAERYGAAWARLADLLGRHSSTVVAAARRSVTNADRDLVTRLLDRELDA